MNLHENSQGSFQASKLGDGSRAAATESPSGVLETETINQTSTNEEDRLAQDRAEFYQSIGNLAVESD